MQNHYSTKLHKNFQSISYGNNIELYYNGLDPGMLNDRKRNQFYDQILKQCKGKRCLDVGSGSGFLAFIALKHGAEHVTCIEQNKRSCEHIQIVAKKMGIPDNKMRVIYDEFRASRFDEYDLGHIDIIFHEIVGGHIWNEMMGNTFNVPLPNIKIIPSQYKIDFSIIPIKDVFYRQLIDYQCDMVYKEKFKLNLGIDLSQEYIDYYEEIINSEHQYNITRPLLLKRLNGFSKEPNFIDLLYDKSKHLHTSVVDINHMSLKDNISIKLPKTNKPYLILCHCYMSDNDHVLDFKYSTSFSSYNSPILVPPNRNYKDIFFHLYDGCMTIATDNNDFVWQIV